MEVINALGRRKSAVARVYVTTGKGNITINGRTLEEYFKEETLRYIVRQPLNVTETLTDFDIKVNLDGGGIKGQAEALRLAISRALCEINKEAYRPVLKSNGFLTRDAREVERKKPGQPGARRRFQFHVDASSSANVSIYVEHSECTVRIQNGQTPVKVTARLSCCEKFGRPAA